MQTRHRHQHLHPWRGSAAGRALWILLAAVVLALALYLVSTLGNEDAADGVGGGPGGASEQAPRAASAELSGSSEPEAGREAQGSAEPAAAGESPAEKQERQSAASPVELSGRVLDLSGLPLSGVGVGMGRSLRLAESGPGGEFRLSLTAGWGQLTAVDDRYVALRASRVDLERAERELLLIVGPRVDLSGRVLDGDGKPLPGAEVSTDLPLQVFAGFPLDLAVTERVSQRVTTDGEGRFSLQGAAAAEGAQLTTSHDGWKTDRRSVPPVSTEGLTIQLEGLQGGRLVRGQVIHADGRAAQSASVHLGNDSVESGEDGHFELHVPAQAYLKQETPLVAVLEGFQPAVEAGYGALVRGEGELEPLQLRLGGPPLSISGRVLEPDGEAGAGWVLNIVDPTEISAGRVPPITAEDLASGRHLFAPRPKTDSEGRFEIGGLLARDYSLHAYDPERLTSVRSEPVAAGTRELLLRAEGRVLERLRGRLVDMQGVPLAGIRVTPSLITVRTGTGTSWISGTSVVSDEEGRFEIEGVPSGVNLKVAGDEILPADHELDAEAHDAEEELRISLLRRLRFRYEGVPGEEAPSSMSALDADGRQLSLWTFESGGWSSSNRVQLKDGRSHVLAVSEAARELVLYREWTETGRLALDLVPGEISVIRP